MRDFDGYIYLREWSGGILGGGFEPMGKPVFHDGIPPKFEYQLLNEDWDQFREYISMVGRGGTVVRMSDLAISFTPR